MIHPVLNAMVTLGPAGGIIVSVFSNFFSLSLSVSSMTLTI